MTKIHKWHEIKDQFTDTLLVGNGGSISFSNNFNYDNLYNYASNNEFLNESHKDIFNKFSKSKDFERVLYRLWQADYVNKRFEINEEERKKVRKAYTDVRRCLIDSVAGVHPEEEAVKDQLYRSAIFMLNFKRVFSLNYDLIIQWAIQSFHKENPLKFFDFFSSEKKGIEVLYPHGNLMFYTTKVKHNEEKIKLKQEKTAIDEVKTSLANPDRSPLFVSEGTSDSKLTAISSSAYLKSVYHEALPRPSDSLVIYGWSIGKHDKHILTQLKEAKYERIAVSVYGETTAAKQRETENIKMRLEGISKIIVFFDAQSQGCWNNK